MASNPQTTPLEKALREVFKCPGLTSSESAQVVLRHPYLIEAYRDEIKEAMNVKN